MQNNNIDDQELDQALDEMALSDAEEATENSNQDETLALKEEISDLTDKLLRQAADAENVRKRYEKQIEEAKIYAIGNFAKDMISVMDNLTRALEHKPKELTNEMQNILTGVDMTQQELGNIFTKYKMKAISPSIGDKFDYNLHSAVSQVATNDHKEGTILHVMQTGYMIEDRLLRPAMVTVTKSV